MIPVVPSWFRVICWVGLLSAATSGCRDEAGEASAPSTGDVGSPVDAGPLSPAPEAASAPSDSGSPDSITPDVALAGSDFATRCSDPNVLRCYGFDDPAKLAPHIYCGAACPEVDSTIKTSGAGSMRMRIPSNSPANTSGGFRLNLTPNTTHGGKDPAYPDRFGEGEEFYVQWRQRFSQDFVTRHYLGAGGWKQAIVGVGDRPGHRASSCTDLGIVTQNTWHRGFPQMYHSCGVKDGKYEGLDVPYGKYDYDFQPPNACLRTASKSGQSTDPPCFLYYADEWLTFQIHVKVGTWYKNDKNYCTSASRQADAHSRGINSACSTIELWVARQGQPSRLVLQRTDYDLVNTDVNNKYGKVWLLPYNTGKDASKSHPVGYTWYDDLIISRAKIADPGNG